jgi:hypothetical protein
MNKWAKLLIFLITLASITMTSSVSADRSYRVHSPRGGVITLVVTDSVLKNVRIYDFAFSDDGDTFLITAAPLRSADSSQPVSIGFYEKDTVVQSDYVYIGPEKATHQVHCPEGFDRIVIE